MTRAKVSCLSLAWLCLSSLCWHLSRVVTLPFEGRWIRKAASIHLGRCLSISPTHPTPESQAAIPIEIPEDSPTKRVAYDLGSSSEAIPIEISEDAPTRRVAYEKILRLAEDGELDELLLDIEARASQKAVRRATAEESLRRGNVRSSRTLFAEARCEQQRAA